MDSKKVKLITDLFFCFLFLPVVIMLVPVERWIVKYPVFALTLLCFLYLLYFAIQQMNLPQKAMQKKYWQIVLFGVLVLAITYLISQFPYPDDGVTELPSKTFRRRSQTVWFMSLTVIGYSLSISLVVELFRQMLLKRQIEEKRKTAELALFKAQINPHFLFNTLNTLYGLVVSKSDKAEDAFVKFSSLMKYTYSQIDKESIYIEDEIKYIRDYIDLQRLRISDRTKVTYDFEIDDPKLSIPPMLLISFVENAFKYGISCKQPSEIDISVRVQERVLTFRCSNWIQPGRAQREGNSVGIDNTLSRLNILYPDNYQLDIQEEEGKYTVNLNLKL